MSTVLVVDDKEMLRDSIAVTMQRAGFTVIAASNGNEALEVIARRRPDAVVTDLKMPGLDGIGLIEKVREIDDVLPIVLMTAFGTIETAVKAIRLGAYDYITKPFEGDELVIAIRRAIGHAKLRRENEALRADKDTRDETGRGSANTALRGTSRVLGDSPVMHEIKEKIRTMAPTQGTVLISGESGTGKEVVARAVHEISDRHDQPFLAVNCAAMSETLLESELFGHEKGAFTGADTLRKGRFELAHGGTILLDEISEIRPQIQAKLLRVLQERAFERVGSSTTIGVDVRVIAATNVDLAQAVERGAFREDLFYRLNVIPIHLPPLRDRVDDIPLLVEHFLQRFNERLGEDVRRVAPDALAALLEHPWPGNIRELENLMERTVLLSEGDTIHLGDLPALRRGPISEPGADDIDDMGLKEYVRVHTAKLERTRIRRVLEAEDGNVTRAARRLGISRKSLQTKMKDYGLRDR